MIASTVSTVSTVSGGSLAAGDKSVVLGVFGVITISTVSATSGGGLGEGDGSVVTISTILTVSGGRLGAGDESVVLGGLGKAPPERIPRILDGVQYQTRLASNLITVVIITWHNR